MLKRNPALSVVLGAALAAVGYSSGAHAASPPWFVLATEARVTLGADPMVKVDDLVPDPHHPNDFDLNIHVRCDEKADALADLVSRDHDFGGVHVFVSVFDKNGNKETPKPIPTDPDDAAKLLKTALQGNKYFIKVLPGNGTFDLFVLFTPTVIQFFTDNRADAFDNTNLVAADAFLEILNLPDVPGIHIGTSTRPL